MNKNYIIRHMAKNEISIPIEWANKEGWNPGLNDAHCFYEADHNGFFIGLLNGEPIATGSAIIYDDHFAFCGLYIVKPEFRRQGYGIQLTHERLKYVGDRITGLDGVLDKVSKYARLGYKPAYKHIRFQLNGHSFTPSQDIVELKDIPFEQLQAFDRAYFPAARLSFLRHWITQPNSAAFAKIENNKIQGYGVIRKCIYGYKIGPLFAKTATVAHQIFEALCSSYSDGPIFLDTPEPNENAQRLVRYYGMQPCFEVIRMYRNGIPKIDLDGIYGITTFELG